MKKHLSYALMLVTGSAVITSANARSLDQKNFADQQALVFIENKGQITDQFGNPRTDLDFKMKSGGIQVFVGAGKLHYQWATAVESPAMDFRDVMRESADKPQIIETYRMDVRLVGAQMSTPEKLQPSVYTEQYYTSYCAAGTRVASYQKVVYHNVYPNIDWVLYSKDGKMEYDFVIRPGGKVSDIQLEYSGTTDLRIQDDGSLLAATPFGTIAEAAPYSFQKDGAEVASSFVLKGNKLGFHTGSYRGILTIDPIVSWGTYFGGDGLSDAVNALAVSASGDVFATGNTASASNIATQGAHQVTLQGFEDAFVSKFASNGALLWSTYYGGIEAESGRSIDIDSLGNIYFVGRTGSDAGISTPASHQPEYGGLYDYFIVKLNAAGSRVFGSYFGGPFMELGMTNIKVRGGGVYISGYTMSWTGIATPGAYKTNLDGADDAFVAKFDLNGVCQWSTYYGGSTADGYANSVTADHEGNVYLFGTTNSQDGIATTGAHKTSFSGPEDDHFLVKFNAAGIRQWGTYYGGTGKEFGHFASRYVDCDKLGNVYICGATSSTDEIASAGAHQTIYGGGASDAYVAKFNSAGVRQWATYLGGEDEEHFPSITVANSEVIYFALGTKSLTGMVTANAQQASYAGGSFYGDAAVIKLDGSGNRTYGSYFGGSGMDCGVTIGVDAQGYVSIGGITTSVADIATPNGHMPNYPGSLSTTGFVARFCFTPDASQITVQGPDSVCRFGDATYTAPVIADATAYIWSLPDGWSGTSATNTINVTTSDMGGAIGLSVVRCGDTSELVSMPVTVRAADPATLTYEDGVLTANGDYTSYSWVKNGQVIPSTNFPSVSISEDGEYQVITVNAFGCTDTSDVFVVEGVHTNDLSRLSQAIRIFPNPAQELVHIQSPVSVNVQITTIEGRVLMPANAANSISLQSLSPGMYLVRISTPDGKLLKSEKLVKMR